MSTHRLLYATWTLFVLAWLLPVHKDGVTLPEGLPGWEAFRLAASPVWPYKGTDLGTGWGAALSVATAATNLLMLGSMFVAFGRSRRVLRVTAWVLLAGFLVDARWLEEARDLRAGYFAWWLAFVLAAFAFSKLRASDSPPARSAAAA